MPLLQSISSRLANIEAAIAAGGVPSGGSSGAGGSGGKGAEGELPRQIKSYDEYCSLYLEPFVAACNKLGGDAEKTGGIVKLAWAEMRSILLCAASCKEPAQTALPELLKGVFTQVKAAKDCINRNDWEKHTKAVGEGMAALNWLAIKPAPCDYIGSCIEGSDYWANNIRKEFRTTNPDQIAFCDTFKTLLKELSAYVKEYHTTGVSWNSKGGDVASYQPGASASTSAPSPAPASTAAAVAAPAKAVPAATAPAGAKADLFASLSKEESVTSGLKKVTKDMQTWRSEYKGGDAPAPVVAPKKAAPAVAASVTKGPPKVCCFYQ